MEHEGNRARQDTGEQCHVSGQADQQSATERITRPSMTMPPTVLLTELDNGAFILQGRPDGPRVWLEPSDAMPLKRELAAVFERIEAAIDRLEPAAVDDDQDTAR